MVLADRLLGRENPWAKVFDSIRLKPLAGGSTFLSENVRAGIRLLRSRLSRPRGSLPELGRGEGRVLELSGEKVAAHRDEGGSSTSSPRCAPTSAASSTGTAPTGRATAPATARASIREGASAKAPRSRTSRRERCSEKTTERCSNLRRARAARERPRRRSSPMRPPRTRKLIHHGHRLVFDEYGKGPRVVVLLHGLLLSRRMQAPVAEALAERGYRVLCLDLLGHGDSDRPRDMWRYSMTTFGEQTVALLDHLDIEQAVVGGTSLGANATLEAAVLAPERMRGLVIEMPVLDNALVACAVAFAPLLVVLTLGEPLARLAALGARLIPRGISRLADIPLDAVRQDPGPSGAVLQGLFFGRIAPPRSERREIEAPALVIGHGRDPIHPFSDSGMLVSELPNGRLLQAYSLFELRIAPRRLMAEIGTFVDECWPGNETTAPGQGGPRLVTTGSSGGDGRRATCR
jgi:pimeloyl-ACP methyl ester carboxylesterase